MKIRQANCQLCLDRLSQLCRLVMLPLRLPLDAYCACTLAKCPIGHVHRPGTAMCTVSVHWAADTRLVVLHPCNLKICSPDLCCGWSNILRITLRETPYCSCASSTASIWLTCPIGIQDFSRTEGDEPFASCKFCAEASVDHALVNPAGEVNDTWA